MYLPEGADRYDAITWERAFAVIAEELTALASPDEALFYTSGRTSNEAAFLLQLFAREFGTNNLPDCSNMCHESSGSALNETIGIGKGSVSLEGHPPGRPDSSSPDRTPAPTTPGCSPPWRRPRTPAARSFRRQPAPRSLAWSGSRTRTTPHGMLRGTPLNDLFLQIRIGGDQALFRLLNKLILATEGAVDTAFITEHTHGYEEFAKAAEAADWDETLAEIVITDEQDKRVCTARLTCLLRDAPRPDAS
ncbi:Formate dehydrogenase OS=Streptomyces microflavus OX=1919 GN=Smic_17030 PE=4 SV=1 [Streptomyces microflavus]